MGTNDERRLPVLLVDELGGIFEMGRVDWKCRARRGCSSDFALKRMNSF
jgi:hypothetical protein